MGSNYPRSSATGWRQALVRTAFVSVLMMLEGCQRQQAPTTDEIRSAYAAHVAADPAHAVGLAARSPLAVIPNQQPACTPDGNSHFDCEIDVFYDVGGGNRDRRSARHAFHIRKDGSSWVIESLN